MVRVNREAVPPCFALVHPGLEAIACDEIVRDLGGEIKKQDRGLVVFRVPKLDTSLLELRTTEDVYLLAWGTDDLTFRAIDLKNITKWTSRTPDWPNLLRFHHQIHAKPHGKPTYRLITQMEGKPCYRRIDAGKALAEGLEGVFPASWKLAEENASVEVWLKIRKKMAICGIRLSDRTMRHRKYKHDHLPASLRPSIAAEMDNLKRIYD